MITVPVTAGFAAVEEAEGTWAAANDSVWYFGKVYDEHDRPLSWWTARPSVGPKASRPSIGSASDAISLRAR
jgi:hypothetical protein